MKTDENAMRSALSKVRKFISDSVCHLRRENSTGNVPTAPSFRGVSFSFGVYFNHRNVAGCLP
jgi:hypothetical protein